MTLLLVCACAIGAHAQLLYRISGNGLDKPSYIVGTHHLASTQFVDKIVGVKEALAATDQVYGELTFETLANPDSMAYLQRAMMLPDGKHLKDVLTEAQYQKLNALLTKTIGADLTNPQLEAQLGQVSPMGIVTQLTLISYMMRHPGEFDPTNGFDQYFQTEAKKSGKPSLGLETIAFQAQVLFNGSSLERQVERLECYIDNKDFSDTMTEEMTKAFFAQDLAGIKKAMDEKLNNSCDDTPEEEAALISNRNADWLKKMPAIIAAKPTFFAVGAAHLPGDKGVLDGLRKLGYTVEGVK